MQIFQTNAALGYQQLAFLIKLRESENGSDYLCIGVQNVHNDSYIVGNEVLDLEDFYVEPSTFTLEESPLYNSLVEFFIYQR
jgi:hypothetical protein